MIVPQNAEPSMPATQNRDARERALDHPNDERAFDRGARDGDESLHHQRLVFVTERHVIKDPLQDRAAIPQEVKHAVEHDEEVQKENGRLRRHARSARHEKSARGFRRRADTFHDMLLARHMSSNRGKPLHQPGVGIERARGAEVLLDPRDGPLTYVESLLHRHPEEGAERPDDEQEEDAAP